MKPLRAKIQTTGTRLPSEPGTEAGMVIRAGFSIFFGLFLLATLFYGNQARADGLESISREAILAYNTSDFAKAIEKGQEAA